MEFRNFDEYVKHRLSLEEIEQIKQEAKEEFNDAMHKKYCCDHSKDLIRSCVHGKLIVHIPELFKDCSKKDVICFPCSYK